MKCFYTAGCVHFGTYTSINMFSEYSVAVLASCVQGALSEPVVYEEIVNSVMTSTILL
jgi:hypothetical protein